MRSDAIESLKNCFPKGEPIYVRRIPNEYCPLECCSNWLMVTTKIGHIKIGWRKRVINIDWSDTDQPLNAQWLFPNEDTTKGDFYIHAWGYEKAKEYLNVIINGAK